MDEINWRRKTHKHTRARWAHATIQSENQFHLVAAKRIYFRIFLPFRLILLWHKFYSDTFDTLIRIVPIPIGNEAACHRGIYCMRLHLQLRVYRIPTYNGCMKLTTTNGDALDKC